MNDMMSGQLKESIEMLLSRYFQDVSLIDDADINSCHKRLTSFAYSILAECRDMINKTVIHELIKHCDMNHYGRDNMQYHVPESAEAQYGKGILTFDNGAITVDWKRRWLAWDKFQNKIVNIIPGMVESVNYCISIPTAEQLASEIGGVRVMAREIETGEIVIMTSADEIFFHNHIYDSPIIDERNIARAICEKFNIPILPWEQIQEQYGGKAPELEG